MAKINPSFSKLKDEYVFPMIDRKLAELEKKIPSSQVINLGVGDIALPLAPSIGKAIRQAVSEMEQTKKGYGPTEGYLFLRQAIANHEFAAYGIGPDEIFISEGITSDAANLQELFSSDALIGIADPTYPIYRDTHLLAGKRLLVLPCDDKTGFLPVPPKKKCDLVYFCSPGNPTGTAMNRKLMTAWVKWAKHHKAILIHDNAYVAYITSPDVPRSIFEIPGAKDVAIELRTFSKSAGFTGLRCGYVVCPKTVRAQHGDKKVSIRDLWEHRQAIKTNGVSYPIQKGAEAFFTPQGQKETQAQVAHYLLQGKILREGLIQLGQTFYGGIDAPYIWWKLPGKMKSWKFFDLLLEKCQIVAIPGRGFGPGGEGYLRLSTFTTSEKAKEAISRLCHLL